MTTQLSIFDRDCQGYAEYIVEMNADRASLTILRELYQQAVQDGYGSDVVGDWVHLATAVSAWLTRPPTCAFCGAVLKDGEEPTGLCNHPEGWGGAAGEPIPAELSGIDQIVPMGEMTYHEAQDIEHRLSERLQLRSVRFNDAHGIAIQALEVGPRGTDGPVWTKWGEASDWIQERLA